MSSIPLRKIPWPRYGYLLLLALAVAWAFTWFLNHFDRAERSRRGPASLAARQNPWLGLEQFLHKAQVPLQHHDLLTLWDQEWPVDVTLVSASAHLSLNPVHQAKLRTWVMRGGHLFVPLAPQLAEGESEALGGLLAEFQIYLNRGENELDSEPWRFALDLSSAGAVSESYREDDDGYGDEVDTSTDIETSEADDTIAVFFDDRYYLSGSDDPAPWFNLSGWEGEHVLSYSLGAGQVTVLSSGAALTNSRIDAFDHAWFFYQMSGASTGRQLWFVENRLAESLWAWLWRRAWALCLSLVALFGLWLWRHNLRWGPQLAPGNQPRRHLGQHLAASADFLWRHGQVQALVAAEEGYLIHHWAQCYPGLLALARPQQWRWIIQRSALSAAEQAFMLDTLLQLEVARPRLRAREFLRLAQLMQRMRSQVSAGLDHAGFAPQPVEEALAPVTAKFGGEP